MPEAPKHKVHRSKAMPPWLPAVDRLLIAAIKAGPLAKRKAINKVLELVPEWTRGHCWRRLRQLRKTPELATLHECPPGGVCVSPNPPRAARPRPKTRRWTASDDDRLLNMAGYETVKKIASRLGRTIPAVRFRMCALGMSARATDGWSLRALQKNLRMSRARLRHLIGRGFLRVRDPRISGTSLQEFREKHGPLLDPAILGRIEAALKRGEDGFSWERTAELLGVTTARIQEWISNGRLSVIDPYITDRAFEEFCRQHGSEINTAMMDRATAKWLINEYGIAESATKVREVSRAQKHALVVRTCRCGKKIAGNVYFRHAKRCRIAVEGAMRRSA